MCSSASSAWSSSGRCRSRSNGAGIRVTSATSKRTLQTSDCQACCHDGVQVARPASWRVLGVTMTRRKIRREIIRVLAYAYVALVGNRLPASIGVLSGTGFGCADVPVTDEVSVDGERVMPAEEVATELDISVGEVRSCGAHPWSFPSVQVAGSFLRMSARSSRRLAAHTSSGRNRRRLWSRLLGNSLRVREPRPPTPRGDIDSLHASSTSRTVPA